MTTTETKQRAEPITKPPTRWRNRWRVLRAIDLFVRGVPYGVREPGEYTGQTTHASRELAEQVAVNCARNNPVTHANVEYLGAVPVEDEE